MWLKYLFHVCLCWEKGWLFETIPAFAREQRKQVCNDIFMVVNTPDPTSYSCFHPRIVTCSLWPLRRRCNTGNWVIQFNILPGKWVSENRVIPWTLDTFLFLPLFSHTQILLYWVDCLHRSLSSPILCTANHSLQMLNTGRLILLMCCFCLEFTKTKWLMGINFIRVSTFLW